MLRATSTLRSSLIQYWISSHIDWHEDAEWKEFYLDAVDPIPPDAPSHKARMYRSASTVMQHVWQCID